MKVLITGGAGFIGSHLSGRLLLDGNTVTVIDNLSTGNYNNIDGLTLFDRFTFVNESILNASVMDRLVSECDIIYHLAAVVGVMNIIKDPVKTIETNVLGTEIVLKTANRYRKKVFCVSTSEIYGKGVREYFKEDDDRLLGPVDRNRWSYACSKALDEFLALAYYKQMKLPVVICRLFNTVGVRQTGHYGMVIPRLIQQALTGEPLTVYGDGKQTRCFCNVTDVIEAFLLLAGNSLAEGKVFNLGSVEEISIKNLAEMIINLSGSTSKIKFIPYNKAYEDGFEDMQRRKPDLNKIKTFCGWTSRCSLEYTLKDIIQYEREKIEQNSR